VRRIQRHKILVAGSFVIGLDVDRRGVGRQIAEAAARYGVNMLNVLLLTPLPGTRLWEQMIAADRVVLDEFPQDWAHYTLGFPVVRYMGLSMQESIEELDTCNRDFYSMLNILKRAGSDVCARRQPLTSLICNLASRGNVRMADQAHAEFRRVHGGRFETAAQPSAPALASLRPAIAHDRPRE
jgi:hypothetical protein